MRKSTMLLVEPHPKMQTEWPEQFALLTALAHHMHDIIDPYEYPEGTAEFKEGYTNFKNYNKLVRAINKPYEL